MTIREKSGRNLNNLSHVASQTVLSVGPDSRVAATGGPEWFIRELAISVKQAIFLQHVLMKMSFLGFI